MKTIKNFMLVAFAATISIACQKELANDNDILATGDVVTFTGSLDQAQTKTAIWYTEEGAEFPTLFTSSDKIAVNNVMSMANIYDEDKQASEYKEGVSPSKDQTSITFDVKGVTAPYYAVTGTHSKAYADGVYTIQVSGTGAQQKFRTVADGKYVSFWTSADILAAYSETESLKFKHMSTFYAITIDSENSTIADNIKNIYIRQGDGSNIAGQWTLKFDENHKPFLEPSNLTAFIGYDCGEAGVAQGTTMIVGLPSYNYESGLIITIKDVNGKFASYKVAAEKTQHAADGGKIIPFKPAFKPGDGVINSAADWNEFAAFVNNTNEKKDWEIYRWIGAGGNTITLGKDIEAEDLDPITVDFTYTLDGNGKTITRTNAKKALFTSVSGTVKNLTLAGNFEATASQGDAPFVGTLAPGGTISGCTNKMTVTFEKEDHAYVAGIVKMMTGGTIEDCVNDGTITAKLINTSDKNVAVAGIVAQVNASKQDIVVIKNCINKKAVTFAPVVESSSYGSKACGVGGIAGWLRAAKSFTLENCDNEGPVTYSAEYITSANGAKAYPICVGGVVGIAAAQNTSGYIEDPLTVAGHSISMTGCDNSGAVYNCGVVYLSGSTSNKREIKKRVFTGGLVGSLTGQSDKYASLVECTNTGSVTPYDLTGGTASTQACYSSVVGGLIGFGAYVDMNNCTVKCTMGTDKRPVMAYGGVIGCAVGPFHLIDSKVRVEGYYHRIENYQGNRAVVAAVPVLFGTTVTNTMSIAPAVTGSKITNCKIGGNVKTTGSALKTAAGEATTDLSGSDWGVTLFNGTNKITGNYAYGQGYTSAETDLTVTDVTYWNGN